MTSQRIKVPIFVVIFVGLTSAQFNKQVGDSCQTDSNKPGQCKYFEDCSLSLLSGEPQPTICAWESDEAIVCCPGYYGPSPSTNPGVGSRRPQLPPGALAKQKCKEFRDKKDLSAIETIVGGENVTDVDQFPHMALLGYDFPEGTQWLCGGTLISDRHVLTAAHCLGARDNPVSRVQLGLIDKRNRNGFGTLQEYKVARIINNPNRAPPQQYHDIGLLELERPVRYTKGTYPACLQSEANIRGSTATAIGWGALAHGEGKGSDILQKVKLGLKSFEECSPFYEPNSLRLQRGLDFTTQLCAGEIDHDTCKGDSGGPLQIFNDLGMPSIIGITSFGQYCGGSPGVYTRVSNYVPWIEKEVWGNN